LLPYREASRRRLLVFHMSGMAGLALIATMACAVAWWFQDQEIENLKSQKNQQQTQLTFLTAKVKSVDRIEKTKKEAEQKITIIDSLQVDRGSMVNLWNVLVAKTPDQVWYSNLVLRGRDLTMTGYARSSQEVSDLVRELDESGLFSDVPNINSVEKQEVQGVAVSRFRILAVIKKPEA